MLEPGERTLLLETLTPPEGYTLDEAIGTTYTLDLLSLLAVPLAFTLFDWEDAQGQPTRDPILLLEALRRHMERITVFCQSGRTAVPNKPNPLFAYLEESVVEVRSPDPDGVFHPKIWVLRFVGSEEMEEPVRYRFVCLTRNLTEDRSWDLSAVLEGAPKDRQRAIAASRPLGDFIAALPGLALREISPAVRKRVDRLAEELRRVDWEVPEPFESYEMHPLGITGYKTDPTLFDADRGIAISPFLTFFEVKEWADPANTLISRPEALDKISAKLLAQFKEVLVLRTEAMSEEEGSTPIADGSATESGLHAKCYVMDAGRDTRVFMGSANLTHPAFGGKNIEFLVELRGKKSKSGVASFLDGDPGEASLRTLLQPYAPPEEPVEEDLVATKLDDLVNAARDGLASAGLVFETVMDGEGGGHSLALTRTGGKLDLPAECSVRVWPITLPAQSSGRELLAATKRVDFGRVALSALTTFLAVEVIGRKSGRTQEARFVLNLPLNGAPEGRREAVLRSILDDPEKVMRFLQFLLEDADMSVGVGVGVGSDEYGASSQSGGSFVLLESLLRALTRDPGRLDHVESLLEEFGDDPDAKGRLPSGLLDLWPAIWAARQELKR